MGNLASQLEAEEVLQEGKTLFDEEMERISIRGL